MTAGRRCALPIGSSVRPKPANRTEVDAGSHNHRNRNGRSLPLRD